MFYLIILIWFVSSQQDSQKITEISNYFSDLKIACKHNENVWGKNLYGPILFVERSDRTVYANRNTDSGLLKKNGSIFTGKLPDEINLANTAVEWNGRRWAMIMLPISTDKQKRINLMAHELFHLWQPDFGFKSFNPDLKHLDQKNGRIYLRLETEALKQAALKPDEAEKHLRNALTFRSYRNQLYPKTDSLENLLELNEGICEFTGQELSGRTEQERLENFIKRIDYFVSTPSYLRSFAYETIPVYGYFLKQLNSD